MAHSSFKVKAKASYCGDHRGLEEAFVTAKMTADGIAADVCSRKNRIASRVTEFKTDVDKSDCEVKVKAKYVCAIEPIEPIGPIGKLPEGSEQEPTQEPKTEPVPVPVPQQGPTQQPK